VESAPKPNVSEVGFKAINKRAKLNKIHSKNAWAPAPAQAAVGSMQWGCCCWGPVKVEWALAGA